MSIVDFVENYSFQEFNEVQEIHWHSFQLTTLIHICYQWNDAYLMDPNSVEDKYIIKYQYYFFYDTKHDMLCVAHSLDQTMCSSR